MVTKAIIPVRAGSQRVRNKNIRSFANSSLLEIKIRSLQEVKGLDGIIVNSDSDEMLEIAEKCGAQAVKRDAYFASSSVSINEVYVDLANHCDADTIILADATNPMITPKTVEKALEIYNNESSYDSVNTVNSVKMFLWKDGQPLNYKEENKPRSQDLPEIFAINSAINVISKETMIKRRAFVGYKPYLLPVDDIEGIDIDTELDFEFAEFLYRKYRM